MAIYLSNNADQIIHYLQENGMLNKQIRCHKCNSMMELKFRECGDKKTWKCPKYNCQTFKSVRVGSWIESNRIPWSRL
jgi:hypothetical protein